MQMPYRALVGTTSAARYAFATLLAQISTVYPIYDLQKTTALARNA
jgi:hypothetical protein